MKIKGRKVLAFITTLISLHTIYFITLVYLKENIIAICVLTMILLVTNGIVLIGGNTLDKWLKTKFLSHPEKEEVKERVNFPEGF